MDGEDGGAEFVSDDGGDGPLDKICSSLTAMCLGILLFPCSLFLLGWNENNYVCENSRIIYADTNAKEVGCDASNVVDTFAFFSCPFVTSSLEVFTPCTFNRQSQESCSGEPPISFTSVSGKQLVEMYQCQEECTTKETKNHLGQNVKKTSCRYSMTWSTHLINSAEFRYSPAQIAQGCPNYDVAGGHNPLVPTNLDMGQSKAFATGVLVGDSANTSYTLNRDLIHQLDPSTIVNLQPFAGKFTTGAAAVKANTQPWTRPLQVSAANVMVIGDYLQTCAQPLLGCVRVSYFRSSSTSPTVITKVATAGQTGEEEIPGSWGCSTQGWQAILPEGMKKSAMIKQLQDMNSTLVWVLRIVGLIAAWLSVYCCFQPISAAADLVGDVLNFCPCGGYLEDFLEGIVESFLCAMSCGIGCSAGLVVIAIVWLFMRPLIGGGLLAVGLLLCCCVAGVRSIAEKKATKGRKGGRSGRPPVDPGTARDFLEALRAEYVYGAECATQQFFDRGVAPEDQQALAPFEEQVRGAWDKREAIGRLAVRWGLEDSDSEAE